MWTRTRLQDRRNEVKETEREIKSKHIRLHFSQPGVGKKPKMQLWNNIDVIWRMLTTWVGVDKVCFFDAFSACRPAGADTRWETSLTGWSTQSPPFCGFMKEKRVEKVKRFWSWTPAYVMQGPTVTYRGKFHCCFIQLLLLCWAFYFMSFEFSFHEYLSIGREIWMKKIHPGNLLWVWPLPFQRQSHFGVKLWHCTWGRSCKQLVWVLVYFVTFWPMLMNGSWWLTSITLFWWSIQND